MEENKPGIDGNRFKIVIRGTLSEIKTLEEQGLVMKVLTDPLPYTKENKSKWKLINWWRKLVGTYYESGYKYTVKVLTDENS
jgi:hypothetical protein